MKTHIVVERVLIFIAGILVAYGLMTGNSSILVLGNLVLFLAGVIGWKR